MKLDVIIVPDFQGPSQRVFEYTTSLFLASWLEHKSQLSSCQLHVVCVGNPPSIPKYLAKRARAHLTVREPAVGPDRFRNKLLGLQIAPSTEHFLLLDTDVVLFQSIDQIAVQLTQDCMQLGYASGAHLSLAQWSILYDRLGMDLPTSRVVVVNAAFGHDLIGSPWYEEFGATVPYFNGGVVAAPWGFGVGVQWQGLIDRLPRILQTDPRMQAPVVPMALYDQPPLAIAVDILQREGRSFCTLPNALHTRWQHVCLGLVRPDEVAVAHNTGLFKGKDPTGIPSGIEQYAIRTRNRMKNRTPTALQQERLANYARCLEDYLLMLYEKWIATVQD